MIIAELYNLYVQSGKDFTDSRQASSGGIFFALKGEHFDGNDFALRAIEEGAQAAVVDSPDLRGKPGCIYVGNVLDTLQQLANFHRNQLAIPILAITGTNGKTTTKELITAVLNQKYSVWATQGNLNNHIGVPLTLLSMNKTHQIGVVEMGANHPGEIAGLCAIAEPNFGLITNVGKAHLEGFGSFEGVIRTKGELYQSIAKGGEGIFINAGNEYLTKIAPSNVSQYTYGVNSANAQLKGEVASNDGHLTARVLFDKGWLYLRSNLTGSYNIENILAAARVGLYFGVDPLLIQKGIESYVPKNNRSQIMKTANNTVLLDCYNANPSSMEASIRNFMEIGKPHKIVICGDMLELGESSSEEHQKIVDLLASGSFEQVFLVGKNFMGTNAPDVFQRFENVDQLKPVITESQWNDKFFFVKGSHSIHLENLMEVL
jgi:UDP-N-acetylmuramoyl-tripeptide--D-alanyl-D-alanine ligase